MQTQELEDDFSYYFDEENNDQSIIEKIKKTKKNIAYAPLERSKKKKTWRTNKRKVEEDGL